MTQRELPIAGAFQRVGPRWREETVADILPTDSSMEWFLRNHRRELAEAGELIIRGGSGGSFAGPNLRAVILDILRRESLVVA